MTTQENSTDNNFYSLTKSSTAITQENLLEVIASVSNQVVAILGLGGDTKRAAGEISSLGTSSGSSAITTGFRPSIIRLSARSASSSHASGVDIVWVNSTVYATAFLYNEGSAGTVDSEARLYNVNSTTDYMEFTITSVTNTGFTITWSETGTFSPSSSLLWSAEH